MCKPLDSLVIVTCLLFASVVPIAVAYGQVRPATRVQAMQALRRARVATQVGEPDEAKKLVQTALDFAKQSDDRLVLAWAQHASGELAFAAGQFDAAVAAFTAALEGFSGLGDGLGMAGSRVNLGRLLTNGGKPREALKHQELALEAYKKLNRPAELAAAWAEIAATHRALGAVDEAEAAWERALSLYRGEAAGQPAAERAVLANLGALKVERGKHQEAIPVLAAAVKLAVSQKDAAAEAGIRNTLAMTHQRQGAFDDALGEYQAALKIRTTLGSDPAGEAELRNNLGALYLDRGESQLALAELNKALALVTQLKDGAGTARVLYNLAVAQESLSKPAEAIANYDKALAIRRELKDSPGIARVLDNLAVVHASQGNTQKAKAYRDEAEQLRQP